MQKVLDQLLAAGYSHNGIAGLAGVPRQYLCDIEKGRRAVGELFIYRLCYALDMDAGLLLYGKAKRKK